MAKKSLGYVELEWTCPSCATRNPGSRRTCLSCGQPQPDNVDFEQPAQEQIITDAAKIEAAKRGPDIHCYYCGSRNPAEAQVCSQCGADLSEGAKRKHGQTLGAHQSQAVKPVDCPACGAPNAPNAPKCTQCGASLTTPPPVPKAKPEPAAPKRDSRTKSGRGGLFGMAGLVILALVVCASCGLYLFFLNSTEDLTGTVSDVSWQRSVTIERLAPVTHEAWRDEIPAEGELGACTPRLRRTQPEPAANAREVCGTPYTVDTGSGYGEVVQDCQYEIYEDFCEYQVEDWRADDEQTLTGSDFSPRWPTLNLTARQREGPREERYICHFASEQGDYDYVTGSFEQFQQCRIGSRWLLKVNTFNTVVDIEPAQ